MTEIGRAPVRLRVAAVLAAALPLLQACAGSGSLPAVPSVVDPPPLATGAPALELGLQPAEVEPPPEGPFEVDEILASRWARDPEFGARVDHWTRFWTATGEGEWFPVYLSRMAAFEELVDGALASRELPPSLRYLPLVESGYSPRAVSRASAVGLWQLVSATAGELGLRVDPLVDERRDPVRSTRAAVRYLEELRGRFGSWFLALAAYNGGPSRLERLLRRHAPLAAPSDSLYLALAPHLPRETREFVARFFAAVRVAREPDRFGVAPERLASPYEFEEVRVPDATSLDVVASAAGVAEEAVVALNPHIVRKITPRGRSTAVRVPLGAGARFAREYPRIPPDERITLTEHVVARGETLWGIARQYGVRLSELEAANPEVDARRLRPGRRLLVPLAPRARDPGEEVGG